MDDVDDIDDIVDMLVVARSYIDNERIRSNIVQLIQSCGIDIIGDAFDRIEINEWVNDDPRI